MQLERRSGRRYRSLLRPRACPAPTLRRTPCTCFREGDHSAIKSRPTFWHRCKWVKIVCVRSEQDTTRRVSTLLESLKAPDCKRGRFGSDTLDAYSELPAELAYVPETQGVHAWARGCVVRTERFCVGTSRSRPPAERKYGPRIHTVQHGYHVVCATKYSILARLVPMETPFEISHKTSTQAQASGAVIFFPAGQSVQVLAPVSASVMEPECRSCLTVQFA